MQNDKFLKEAFRQFNAEYCDSLPSDDELKKTVSFSAEFESKMEKLIKKQNKPYYKLINTVGKRAAVIILAIFIAFNTVTFSVEALREPFIDFIVETYERFSKISFVEKTPSKQKEFVPIKPGYIPEGFDIDTETESDIVYSLKYTNINNNYIMYSQVTNSGSSSTIDTENSDYSKIQINNLEGVIWTNKGVVSVIFSTDNYVFNISGSLPEEEIIKIANSITIK